MQHVLRSGTILGNWKIEFLVEGTEGAIQESEEKLQNIIHISSVSC
jgi:hypothetical protein